MLLLLVLLAGSFLVFRSDSLLFRLYSSKLFHTELSGNTLTLHYLIADPAAYGLNEDPVLPVYTGAEEDREKETVSLKMPCPYFPGSPQIISQKKMPIPVC